MLAGGLLSLLHAVVTIHLRADQVVSGLALTFLGTGLARVLGEGLSNAGATRRCRRLTIPLLVAASRSSARSSSTTRASSSTSATCSCRSPGSGSTGPGRASTCGRSARRPAAADAQGIGVYRLALRLRLRRRRARGPRRRHDHARGVAGLVQRPDDERPRLDRGRARDLRPVEPAPGGRSVPTCSGRSRGSSSTSRASTRSSASTNPFQPGRSATFFLDMLPYLLVILVVVLGSREAARQAGRGAGGARDPVRPGERGRLGAGSGLGYASSRASRPCSSIWTNPLVSNSSWRGASGSRRSSAEVIGAYSMITRSSPWTRV